MKGKEQFICISVSKSDTDEIKNLQKNIIQLQNMYKEEYIKRIEAESKNLKYEKIIANLPESFKAIGTLVGLFSL